MLNSLSDRPVLTLALIAFLIWVGLRALKPRTIRYRQLYILPSVFLVISANQLFNSYPFSPIGLTVWVVMTGLAGIVSWRMAQDTSIGIDREKGRIDLPGTRITLSLMLLFIAARLYFGRQLFLHPELKTAPEFTSQIVAMSGLITGYYLGRSGSFLKRFFSRDLSD